MTDQDKRTIRVQLQIELEDAESALAFEREKTRQLAQQLRGVADALDAHCTLEPSALEFDTEPEPRISPACQEFLRYDAILLAALNLKRARQNAFNLRQRKAQISLYS